MGKKDMKENEMVQKEENRRIYTVQELLELGEKKKRLELAQEENALREDK